MSQLNNLNIPEMTTQVPMATSSNVPAASTQSSTPAPTQITQMPQNNMGELPSVFSSVQVRLMDVHHLYLQKTQHFFLLMSLIIM